MIKTAIASVTLVSLVAGGMVGLDSYFAKKKHLKMIACRVEQKILNDRQTNLEERVFKFEHAYGVDCVEAPVDVKQQCDEWKRDIKDLEKKQENIVNDVEMTY